MSPTAYGSDGSDEDLRAILGADRADLDAAQAAELRRQIADAAASAGALHPPPPGPGELRGLLRECVNVVEPGDVLVIRIPAGSSHAQTRDLHNAVRSWLAAHAPSVDALVVPAEEIKVLHPAPPMATFTSPPGEVGRDAIEAARSRLGQVRSQRPLHAPDTP